MIRYDSTSSGPRPVAPGFLEAKNRRQKARAAGLSPDHFYPVAQSQKLRRGTVLETRFWGRSIALFRDETGRAHALEDRCAHRQLKLSGGQVKGCNLVCQYHGWEYGSDGKLMAIPHDLGGKPFPNLRVHSFPVQERYGLVWIFPGDPKRASEKTLPELPELDGKKRWGHSVVDGEWKTHHSMVIDNVADLMRTHPHSRFQPFRDARVTRCEALGDRVEVRYEATLGSSSENILRRFVDTNRVELRYEYPYLWSNIDDKIKSWCFVLPMDQQTSHTFFLFAIKTPQLPPWLLERLLSAFSKHLVTPLLSDDRRACEAELQAYSRHFDAPIAEFNPAVGLCQQLTIRKWEEYLASRSLIHTADSNTAFNNTANNIDRGSRRVAT